MTFWKTVRAYLTGWLIVQPLYNRLLGAWRRRELQNPSSETRAYWGHQADAIVDELARRNWKGQRHYSTEEVREIAYQAAGACSAVFMEAHPQDVMPDAEIRAGVDNVLREHRVIV
jgi:hypothetical protein